MTLVPLHPEVIFFDYGNTLAADTDDQFRDTAAYLSYLGIDLTRSRFDEGWRAAESYAGEYRGRNGCRSWKRDRFWYNFCRAFLETAVGEDGVELAERMSETQFFVNTIYPDTLAVLEELRRRGYRLGVISNWDAPTLHAQFDRFGMTPFFESILPSYEVEANKPDEHFFRTALDSMQVTPERAIHIGDSFGCDVVGARGVGITPIWVNPDGDPTPDGSSVLQIRTNSDLLDLVM
jgi:HAD superfamily hydrolase (TIGR01549 family)